MNRILVAFVAMAMSPAVLADTPVSEAEAQKIRAALEAWGCSGGKMEKETEASRSTTPSARTDNTTSSLTRISRSSSSHAIEPRSPTGDRTETLHPL